MKIIFLDIDGVLNNDESLSRNDGTLLNFSSSEACFDPECVKQLNRIILETGAFMVMSSAWRYFFSESQMALHRAGLPMCMDATPRGRSRGEEIQSWIDRWKQEILSEDDDTFVIIDDAAVLDSQQHFTVQTTMENGLTAELADKAIRILNNE